MALQHQPFDSTNSNHRHHHHESRVRVGVRIRPQTSLEIQQGGKSSLSVAASSIRMGKRQFTFDAVFDSTCGQTDLYDTVSTPLLSSFVDGYNATVSIRLSMDDFPPAAELHLPIDFSHHQWSSIRFRSSLMDRLVLEKRSPWEVKHTLSQRHLHKRA